MNRATAHLYVFLGLICCSFPPLLLLWAPAFFGHLALGHSMRKKARQLSPAQRSRLYEDALIDATRKWDQSWT